MLRAALALALITTPCMASAQGRSHEPFRGTVRTSLALALIATASMAAAQGRSEEPPPGTEGARGTIDAVMHWIATAIEVAGVAIIVIGAAVATATFVYRGFATTDWTGAYDRYRANLGRGILLGLELLVAADIIGTVAVTPSFQNLAVLGLIVLIRTFLSFSLEVEIEGRWPWRRAEGAGSGPKEGARGAG